jgi:hypothetical protein
LKSFGNSSDSAFFLAERSCDMASTPTMLKGVVHGKLIELDREPGLPDGQHVMVELQPVLPPGEGIRQSAGAWADAGKELDAWLDEMQRSRQQDRPELS